MLKSTETDRAAFLMGSPQYRRQPQLMTLLQAIGRESEELSLDGFDPATVTWAIQSGLGPLLFRAVKQRPESRGSRHWDDVKSADLTARIIVAKQIEAMEEIIDACPGEVPPLTLLKGISIAEQFYPEPHLRLMGDMDFLVDKEFLPAVKATLEGLGYRQRCNVPSSFYDGHHHIPPFLHEEKGIWVEVHHALLSFKKGSRSPRVFQWGNLLSQLRPSEFQGRRVFRLSFELQLVYLAAHWAQGFKTVGGLAALVDTIYLLQQVGKMLSWEWILDAVNGSVAATYLYLMLSYMERNGLVKLAPEILRDLHAAQPSFGRISLRMVHGIIDRYYVAGKAFGPLLSRRNIGILWKTLTLPGSAARNLLLAPVNLALPHQRRIFI